MNYLFGLVYPLMVIVVFLMLWTNKAIKRVVIKYRKEIIIFTILNIVILNVILFLHLKQESFIPNWDSGGFYKRCIEFSQILDKSTTDATVSLINSINTMEYNYVAEWFLYIPMKIIGNTYPRYVISMLNSFLIPSNIIVFILSLSIIEKLNLPKSAIIFCGILIGTFSSNILPMVFGYIGSVGLLFISAILLLLINSDLKKKNIIQDIFIGFSLLLLFLIRRWYAYFIVGFFVALIINYIVNYMRKNNRKEFINYFLNAFICGIIPLSILVLCFYPLFSTVSTYDYADAYSVAAASSPSVAIIGFIYNYGYLIIFLVIIGGVFGLKEKETRYIAVINIVIILIATIMFNRVQGFGSHHYYIINIPVMIMSLLGISSLYKLISVKIVNIVAVVFALIVSFNFQRTILFKGNKLYNITNYIVSYPLPELRMNKDINKYRELANFLNNRVNEYEAVYVLSNTQTLNDDVLRYCFLPDKLEGVKNLQITSAYDARDGIPYYFWQFYYIVVADPIQIQYDESKQRCISVLADFFLNDNRAEDYYNIVDTVNLSNNVNIYVYQRVEMVPNSIRQEISDTLKSYYPNNPKMYTFEMLTN